MSRAIVVLGSLLLLFFGTVYAQKRCPAKSIDDCPEMGCGSWDPEFDRKRNLTKDPKEQKPTPITLEEIRALEYPHSWSLGKDRAELEKLGEGRLVQVTAYLIGVKYGDLSSANCKLAERWSVNDILILVSKADVNKKSLTGIRKFGQKQAKKIFNQREASSVTAEITPRVRLLHANEENKTGIYNWFKEKLDTYIQDSPRGARFVRVTGLLLLDTEHIYKPMQRSTDWQISPVLEIEVCEKKGDACFADADWTKLDKVIMKSSRQALPPPPGVRIPPGYPGN
jgi:hypothetical protein